MLFILNFYHSLQIERPNLDKLVLDKTVSGNSIRKYLLSTSKAYIFTCMSIKKQIADVLSCTGSKDPKQLPALTLAYLGDTIYDLYARTYLSFTTDGTVHSLHMKCTKLVCAKGQAEAFFRVRPYLSEEENGAFLRGRNAHSGTVPKNANVQDYRAATGFESLLGYLYCLGRDERIGELMKIALVEENLSDGVQSENRQTAQD